jgi:hypothetical protein
MITLRPALRRITATLGAAALALGAIAASSVPARANGDDLARVLAGTAALVIIGSAIKDANRHGHPATRVQPVSPAHGWHGDRQRPGWHDDRGWRRHDEPRYRDRRLDRAPASCIVWIDGQRYVQDSRKCGAAGRAKDRRRDWRDAQDYSR